MTAAEKARELVEAFVVVNKLIDQELEVNKVENKITEYFHRKLAKKCALLTAEECKKCSEYEHDENFWDDVKRAIIYAV